MGKHQTTGLILTPQDRLLEQQVSVSTQVNFIHCSQSLNGCSHPVLSYTDSL